MSELFCQAVEARIPLIHVRVSDSVYWEKIVSHYVAQYTIPSGRLSKNQVESCSNTNFVCKTAPAVQLDSLSALAEANDHCVILVNQEECPEEAFDAGEILAPIKFYHAIANSYGFSEVPSSLFKIGLRQAKDILKISKKNKNLSDMERIIRSCRGNMPTGLSEVNVNESFILPNEELSNFIKNEKSFFYGEEEWLCPKGIVLHGIPGTGKSTAAKIVAREWGLPLLKLEVAGMLTKYEGEADQNLQSCLRRVETESPCVLLIDEVEKVLSVNNSTDTINRILSVLLWWLQERTCKVFVVMTTNNIDMIPKELVRTGRVDKQLEIRGLSKSEASIFLKKFCKHYGLSLENTSFINNLYSNVKVITQSDLVEAIKQQVKKVKINE